MKNIAISSDSAPGRDRREADSWWRRIIMTETIRMPQTSSLSLFAPARDDPEPSFWRRLLIAIMAGRQRKADEYLADYLRRHFDERHDELRAAVEQRLADR